MKRCYENTSPRLRARGKLRRAIELIDAQAVRDAVAEIEMLQLHHEPFATMELKVGRQEEKGGGDTLLCTTAVTPRCTTLHHTTPYYAVSPCPHTIVLSCAVLCYALLSLLHAEDRRPRVC